MIATPGSLLAREQERIEREEAAELEAIQDERKSAWQRKKGPTEIGQGDVERTSHRACEQVSRLLVALEFIARHRFGVTLSDLRDHMREEFNASPKTVRRDAAVLVRLTFVFEERTSDALRLRVDPAKLLPRMLAGGSQSPQLDAKERFFTSFENAPFIALESAAGG